MPFLSVNGGGGALTVAVIEGSPTTHPRVPVGRVRQAHSGKARSTVRDYRDQWRGLQTEPMTLADVVLLLAELEGSPPVIAAGDLMGGNVNVIIENIDRQASRRLNKGGVGAEETFVVTFDMIAAD